MNEQAKDNALLQSIFDASIEGILVVDTSGQILDANRSCERMFGYSKGELKDKNLENLLPEKFKKKHNIHRKKYVKKPETRTMGLGLDLWGLKKNGTEFPLDISLSPTTLQGKSVTVAFIKDATSRMMDLTAIQQTNAILKESNRKMGTLISNLQGIVYRCKNDRDWTMEYISEGCEHITGYSPQEFLEGKVHFSHITFKEDQEEVWKETQKALAEKTPFSLTYRIRDKNGMVKYMHELGQGIFNKQGHLTSLEGFISDVTETKKTEEELRKNGAKNKALFEAIPDMMFILDRKGNYLDFFAPDPEKLLIPPEEFIGKNRKDVLPPKVYKAVKKSHDLAVKTKQLQVTEYSLDLPSGRFDYEARTVLLNNHGLLTIVRDVTEKKLIERQLKESESKNRAILNAIPDLIFVHDINGMTLNIQASDPTLFKAPIEELIGKNVTEVLPRPTSDNIIKSIQLAHRTKKMQVIEIVVPIKNRLADFELRSVFLKSDTVLSVARDITEGKAISKVLNIRNRALEAAGNGILIADAQLSDLPIIYANDSFCQVTGYTKSDVIGKNCRFLQNDDRDQDEVKVIRSALKKGKFCHVTLRNYRKDGTLFWNELTMTPVFDELEKLTHFIGIQNDVTEFRQNQEKLNEYAEQLEGKIVERTKEVTATVQKLVKANLSLEDQIQTTKIAENKAMASHALFAAIAQNFPKGVISVFNADMEFVYLEGEELKKYKFDKSDFEGKSIDDAPVISKELKEKMKGDVQKTMSGEHLSFEMTYGKEDYSVNSIPLYADKNITWALFVHSNITEQKKVQQELLNALESEKELNELKSRFISMASHEFRTPLSAILSSAILIGKQNEPGKEEKREKYIKQIKTNVRNLTVILNDFLSLSKLEEGKTAVHPVHFDLVQLTTSVIDEIETSKKEGQNIHLEHEQPVISVFLDAKLMRHILINLISNAIKYSEDNSRIDVKISASDHSVLLKVADEGMGIPLEEQDNLFERFFRAKNATNIQGTGLGLHIVKQYTELMGGTIGFTSEIDKGAVFNVDLPMELDT